MRLAIEQMTTEQKLGMVFCARRFQESDIAFIIKLIQRHALGCVQLPCENTEIVERILAAADYPLIVINDAEMGFPASELPKIPPMSLAACNHKKYYRAFAKGLVFDAKRAGFNGTWGPVVDVLRGDGPCRVHRHFSDQPQRVAEAAEELSRIFAQNRFLSTAKHYPGGADCPFDTHMTEGVSNVTEEELLKYDLLPYLHLHKKGLLPSIMSEHTVFRKIDPDRPASLSKKVIDIIRRLGFDGVIFTDSLAMMGILQKYGEENVYGMAIAAGNDIVLPNYRTAVQDAFEMLVQNYSDGAFAEERLNEAVRRVLAVQEFIGTKPAAPTEFTEEDKAILEHVAADCITCVADEDTAAALSGNEKERLFIVTTPVGMVDGNNAEINVKTWYYPNQIAEKIKQVFPNAGIEFLSEYANEHENEQVLNAATKYREVVFVTYCTTTSYLGTDCLTRRLESVVNCLIHSGKVSTVLHFGNPYALKPLLHVPRKIFGYMIPESQIYAIDVLAGKIEAKGRLPFEIEFQ